MIVLCILAGMALGGLFFAAPLYFSWYETYKSVIDEKGALAAGKIFLNDVREYSYETLGPLAKLLEFALFKLIGNALKSPAVAGLLPK